MQVTIIEREDLVSLPAHSRISVRRYEGLTSWEPSAGNLAWFAICENIA